jgi:hypothetical protein
MLGILVTSSFLFIYALSFYAAGLVTAGALYAYFKFFRKKKTT